MNDCHDIETSFGSPEVKGFASVGGTCIADTAEEAAKEGAVDCTTCVCGTDAWEYIVNVPWPGKREGDGVVTEVVLAGRSCIADGAEEAAKKGIVDCITCVCRTGAGVCAVDVPWPGTREGNDGVATEVVLAGRRGSEFGYRAKKLSRLSMAA